MLGKASVSHFHESVIAALPSPSPVGRTRRHSMAQWIRLPQKEGPHALPCRCRAASCPPVPSASHSPLVHFNGWLLRHLLSHRLHLASCAAISRSLNAWLHCRCPFRIAVAPSIAVAVALPSCRPSPPLLVDCCCFHRHCRVNTHAPLLPSWSLCCACHRRPSPSRHPSPPLLVDCCIYFSCPLPHRRPSPSLRRADHRRRRCCCCVAVALSPSIAAIAS
jgi:hypothetical protein